jgi:hypothetical protein
MNLLIPFSISAAWFGHRFAFAPQQQNPLPMKDFVGEVIVSG